MKDKILEKKVNDMIDVLTAMMSEITTHELANDSLVTEIHNLKNRNEILEQQVATLEAENAEQDAVITKYQALKPRNKKEVPEVEEKEKDPLWRIHPKSRDMVNQLRKRFGMTVIGIKDPDFYKIVHANDCDNSVSGTILALSKRILKDGRPALTVNSIPWANIGNKIVSIQFNF